MPTSRADTIQFTTLCAEMRGIQLKVICPRGSDIAELLQQDLIIQPLYNRRRYVERSSTTLSQLTGTFI